jgi:hypothetical protein
MSLKEKFLILWILGAMLLAFLASHTLAVLVAGFENACAFGYVPVVAVKLAAALFSCGHS